MTRRRKLDDWILLPVDWLGSIFCLFQGHEYIREYGDRCWRCGKRKPEC